MSPKRQEMEERTKQIVAPWKGERGGTIPVLQEVQKVFGYLPEEALMAISRELKIPLRSFSVWPPSTPSST